MKTEPDMLHAKCYKYVPPMIVDCLHDATELCANRQMLMQLHDKQLISTRTLLASFGLDVEVENALLFEQAQEYQTMCSKFKENGL